MSAVKMLGALSLCVITSSMLAVGEVNSSIGFVSAKSAKAQADIFGELIERPAQRVEVKVSAKDLSNVPAISDADMRQFAQDTKMIEDAPKGKKPVEIEMQQIFSEPVSVCSTPAPIKKSFGIGAMFARLRDAIMHKTGTLQTLDGIFIGKIRNNKPEGFGQLVINGVTHYANYKNGKLVSLSSSATLKETRKFVGTMNSKIGSFFKSASSLKNKALLQGQNAKRLVVNSGYLAQGEFGYQKERATQGLNHLGSRIVSGSKEAKYIALNAPYLAQGEFGFQKERAIQKIKKLEKKIDSVRLKYGIHTATEKKAIEMAPKKDTVGNHTVFESITADSL